MKRQPKSAEQLEAQDRTRREVAAEYERLKLNYPAVRAHMTAEAILLAWFLLGDSMWDSENGVAL